MKETINIIPEIFYDIIARFIPATVLFVIYFPNYLAKDFNFQTIITFLLIIHLVGFLLANFGGIVWWLCYFKHPKLIKLAFYKNVKYYTGSQIWKYTREISDEKDKNQHKKLIAEYVMFRSLSIEFIFFLIYKPTILNDFNNLEFILFLFIWWFVFSFSKLHIYRSVCLIMSRNIDSDKTI